MKTKSTRKSTTMLNVLTPEQMTKILGGEEATEKDYIRK